MSAVEEHYPEQLDAPGEVSVQPAQLELYNLFGKQDALSSAYMLPGKYLQGIRPEAEALPEAPLIVFINARSGGRSGPELALTLSRSLGRVQVFDLSEHKPDKVLAALWANFKAAAQSGDPHALWYQSRLRILVAGGDGTITWVLSAIHKLQLQPVPPVSMMPLGTGNDLSRTFGWGHAFDKSWIRTYKDNYYTLRKVRSAQVEDLDFWKVHITYPDTKLLGDFPHCLHVNYQDPPTPPPPGTPDHGSGPGVGNGSAGTPRVAGTATGLFWNYLSVGMDARAAYNFHHLREQSPGLASNRMMNQFWYSYFSCTSGWFCCPKGVSSKVELWIQRPGSDEWTAVKIPKSVKALVILNLQSYAGGRNLWGPVEDGATGKDSQGKPFKKPSYSDTLVEVVGLKHGSHTAGIMATKGDLVHAERLCQAAGIRMAVRAKHVRPDGMPSHAYLQIDGEPWSQDVPSAKDEHSIMIEVTHGGVSKVLHNTELKDSSAVDALTKVPPHATARTRIRGSMDAEAAAAQHLFNVPNPLPSNLRPIDKSAFASTAGADSEVVNVGSERAMSIVSTSTGVSTGLAAFMTTGPLGAAGDSNRGSQ